MNSLQLKGLTIKLRGKPMAKYSVNEHRDGYNMIFWDMEDCAESDAIVREFETYTAALAAMYQHALLFAMDTDTVLSMLEE